MLAAGGDVLPATGDLPPTRGDEPAATELYARVEQIGDAVERYGPVAIARYMKADGRALLLYRHADEQRS